MEANLEKQKMCTDQKVQITDIILNPKLKRIADYSIRGAVVFGLSSIVAVFFCMVGYIFSGILIGLFFPKWNRPVRARVIAATGLGLGFIIPMIAVTLSMLALEGWQPRYGSYAIHYAIYWAVGFGIAGVIGALALTSSLESAWSIPSALYLAATGGLGLALGGEIGGLLALQLFYLTSNGERGSFTGRLFALLLGLIVTYGIGGAMIGATFGWLESIKIKSDVKQNNTVQT